MKIGDNGQRYEIRCDDGTGKEMVVGWSNSPDAFIDGIRLHPVWTNRRVIDRQEDKKKEKSS